MSPVLAKRAARPQAVAGVPCLRRAKLAVVAQAARTGSSASPRASLEASLSSSASGGAAQPVRMPAACVPLPALLSAAGRSADDVASLVSTQLEQYPQALVSGVEPEMYAALRKLVPPGVQYHARAKMLLCKPSDSTAPKLKRLPGTLAVVAGGPEDQAAADRVKLAAEHLGAYTLVKSLTTRDMPSLMDQMPGIQVADVVVVVAGADPALPGVIAGMVDAPVVALPTSSAAGAPGLGGLGNLVAAVSAAAPGVCVVNIDAATSAAVCAARVLRTAAARMERLAAASGSPAAAFVLPAADGANNIVPANATHAAAAL